MTGTRLKVHSHFRKFILDEDIIERGGKGLILMYSNLPNAYVYHILLNKIALFLLFPTTVGNSGSFHMYQISFGRKFDVNVNSYNPSLQKSELNILKTGRK